jgi:uncharacterized protein YkwD
MFASASSPKFDVPRLMKMIKISLLAVALLCLVTSCSKDDSDIANEANYSIDLNLAQETDWVIADEILTLVNDHRVSIGLPIIEKDQRYASAYAVEHTKYMIDLKQISHDNFSERSSALKAQGAKIVGENVAYGYDTAEGVVNAWLNSPGHKDIIEGSYTHSGFGVILSPDGRYYFTQLFYKK